MNDIDSLLRYATRGIIFDTNLFLLFLVGRWNINQISNYSRLSGQYTANDYVLLEFILEQANQLVTTPHILTEICNLTDTLNRQHDYILYGLLADIQANSRERRQEAIRLIENEFYLSLGIADASLVDASIHNHLVITDDLACYMAILRSEGLAININHFRDWMNEDESNI